MLFFQKNFQTHTDPIAAGRADNQGHIRLGQRRRVSRIHGTDFGTTPLSLQYPSEKHRIGTGRTFPADRLNTSLVGIAGSGASLEGIERQHWRISCEWKGLYNLFSD